MNRIAALIALTSALCAAAAAHAAPTVELRVTGVIRPSACTPTLGNSGVADYGTIPAKTLQAGQYKKLDVKQVSLSVTCDAAAKIALVVLDNRASSRVDGVVDSIRAEAAYNFGLGSVAGKNVGGYTMMLSGTTMADGQPVANIYSKDKGASWSSNGGYLDHDGNYFSFAQSGTAPVALKTLAATINVQAVLNKPENLPLNQDVPLDGSATIEIKYL